MASILSADLRPADIEIGIISKDDDLFKFIYDKSIKLILYKMCMFKNKIFLNNNFDYTARDILNVNSTCYKLQDFV